MARRRPRESISTPDRTHRVALEQATPSGVAHRKELAMTPSKDPSPTAVVERLLRAMSRRDVDAMFDELAPDVICASPTAPGGPQEIRGWDTNRTFYSTAIRPMWSTFTLTRSAVHVLADDPRCGEPAIHRDATLAGLPCGPRHGRSTV